MEKTINERIGHLIGFLNKNHKTFAESIGKSPTVIYNTVNGRNKPSFDVLEAICEQYPEVSPAWLLKGDGEVTKAQAPAAPAGNDYLGEYLEKLEGNFARLLNQLETKDQQIQSKDRQIDKLIEQLGKLDVSESTTCKIIALGMGEMSREIA